MPHDMLQDWTTQLQDDKARTWLSKPQPVIRFMDLQGLCFVSVPVAYAFAWLVNAFCAGSHTRIWLTCGTTLTKVHQATLSLSMNIFLKAFCSLHLVKIVIAVKAWEHSMCWAATFQPQPWLRMMLGSSYVGACGVQKCSILGHPFLQWRGASCLLPVAKEGVDKSQLYRMGRG